ncbi:MAG: hypothetical protein HY316_08520 [Acidobacteria bacterium]|nr:hypothetical protein [Acidobacteriota bacterium]
MLAVLAFAVLSAQAQAPTADDSGTVLAGLAVEIVPPVDCLTDLGTIIAWDTFNGGTTADHTILVGDLQALGYTVRTINTANGIPACVRKLLITSQAFNGCLLTPFPAAQVTAIANWVQAGGELFLLNEWGFLCGSATGPIATPLGATWNGNQSASQVYTANANYDPNNPATLFNGVATWAEFAGSDYTAAQNVVATTNAGVPALIAGPVQSGCVVIVGDSNLIADLWIVEEDNRALASNAFVFLNECVKKIVKADIKFCSNPNGYQCKANGVVPVTIFGEAGFNVLDIVISSLRLCRVDTGACTASGPKSWSFFDRGDPTTDLGASQCAIDPLTGLQLNWLNQDGFTDLDVGFDNQGEPGVSQLVGCPGDKKTASPTLVLKGELSNGQLFESEQFNNPGIDQLWFQ